MAKELFSEDYPTPHYFHKITYTDRSLYISNSRINRKMKYVYSGGAVGGSGFVWVVDTYGGHEQTVSCSNLSVSGSAGDSCACRRKSADTT